MATGSVIQLTDLWSSDDTAVWHSALARYAHVVSKQEVARLPALDAWYHDQLPAAIAARATPHITLDELVQLTEWKMARGVWRAPNLILVRGNAPEKVIDVSMIALAHVPHSTRPVEQIATLSGVGPATASAAVAAYAPLHYPFFDELVAAQIPTLGVVAWTLGYYARYATAIRFRAAALGAPWNPAMVSRALWAHVGGKKRVVLPDS